jgi:hypothetical protein
MNLELPTYQANTFSHASDTQTHFISHLLRIESSAVVTHGEKQSVTGLVQIHFGLCRSAMLLQILKTFLDDTE